MRRSGYALVALLTAVTAGCGPAVPSRSSASAGACIGLPGDGPPPPLLPADRPVGRANVIYLPCPDCAPALITNTGVRYGVLGVLVEPPPPPHLASPMVPPTEPPPAPLPGASPPTGPAPAPLPTDPMFGLRLSPDGRWLARSNVEGWLVRDLTGTAVYRIGRGDLGAWSADGRFVVMVSRAPGTDTGFTELVEVATGHRLPVRLPWGRVLAVLGSDQVLAAHGYDREHSDPDPGRETYAVVDPATGIVRRDITADSGDLGQIYPGATIAMGNLLVAVVDASGGTPEEILTVAVDSGRVLGRHRLPAEAPAGFPAWRVAGINGDRVLLMHEVHLGSPSPGVRPETGSPSPVELFLMDPATGDRRLFCTLPAGSEVVVPR